MDSAKWLNQFRNIVDKAFFFTFGNRPCGPAPDYEECNISYRIAIALQFSVKQFLTLSTLVDSVWLQARRLQIQWLATIGFH